MSFRSLSSARRPAVAPTGSWLRLLAAAVLVRASVALERLAVVVGPAPPPAWSRGTLEFAAAPDREGGLLYADGVLVGRLDGVQRL